MTPYRTVVDRYLDAAAEHRRSAEQILTEIEVLIDRFNALEVVPLDVLDRWERVIVKAHTANLGRLWTYTDELEAEK